MTQKRLWIFFLILFSIAGGTYFLIKIAKGYRPNLSRGEFEPTGLLVATSSPNGAAIYLDGKLQGATDTNLYLAPGTYEVEIKKDGYYPWQKTFEVEKEYVAKTDAWLLPTVPNFQAQSYTGAAEPLLSPDGSKLVYRVFSEKMPEKNGLWVLDLSELPFGMSREPKQIAKNTALDDFTKAVLAWLPDSRQILTTFQETQTKSEKNFLLDPSNLNPNTSLTDISFQLPLMRQQWEKEKQAKFEQKLTKLPPKLIPLLEEKTKDLVFSPDETKILYVATASATIPEKLISPVHSLSNQPQARELKPNQTYIYDIKEDRNYLILESACFIGNSLPVASPTPTPTPTGKKTKSKALGETEIPSCFLSWVPNSRHVLWVEKEKISLQEFEGTNKTAVYQGAYQYPFAFITPAANKLIILTTLTNASEALPNLYAVSLR